MPLCVNISSLSSVLVAVVIVKCVGVSVFFEIIHRQKTYADENCNLSDTIQYLVNEFPRLFSFSTFTCVNLANFMEYNMRSRVCTVVHYAVLEAIRALYGIWQI